jgi:anti-sigma B factor antagonist
MRHDGSTNAGSPDLGGQLVSIESRGEGDSVIVAVAGELDLSTADQLDAAIREAEETETNRIVVDLSALHFVDSTGLSVLVDALKRSRSDGNRLSFVPSEHEGVTRLFALTGTTEMFG